MLPSQQRPGPRAPAGAASQGHRPVARPDRAAARAASAIRERRLPPVVHVAGTNGKGSVLAYLRAMLEAAGQRVHVYTSPHLVRFHERIRLAGQLIDGAARWPPAGGVRARPTPARRSPSSRSPPPRPSSPSPARRPTSLLLEIGLGGRLDATNVIERPGADRDHADLARPQCIISATRWRPIAGEKAGILKPGVPAWSAPQPPEAAAVIRGAGATCEGAAASSRTSTGRCASAGGGLLFSDAAGVLRLPLPALVGPRISRQTPASRIACRPPLAPAAVDEAADRRRGLRTSATGRPACSGCARGRWSPCCRPAGSCGSMAATIPAPLRCWRRHLAGWRERPLFLVFGMLRTKDARGFLALLAPFAPPRPPSPFPAKPRSMPRRRRRWRRRLASTRGRRRTCHCPALARRPIPRRPAS